MNYVFKFADKLSYSKIMCTVENVFVNNLNCFCVCCLS